MNVDAEHECRCRDRGDGQYGTLLRMRFKSLDVDLEQRYLLRVRAEV